MTRTEQRECVFKLLFRVEFNEPDEMAQQKVLFFADDETSYSEKDQAYIADKFERIKEAIPAYIEVEYAKEGLVTDISICPF